MILETLAAWAIIAMVFGWFQTHSHYQGGIFLGVTLFQLTVVWLVLEIVVWL